MRGAALRNSLLHVEKRVNVVESNDGDKFRMSLQVNCCHQSGHKANTKYSSFEKQRHHYACRCPLYTTVRQYTIVGWLSNTIGFFQPLLPNNCFCLDTQAYKPTHTSLQQPCSHCQPFSAVVFENTPPPGSSGCDRATSIRKDGPQSNRSLHSAHHFAFVIVFAFPLSLP